MKNSASWWHDHDAHVICIQSQLDMARRVFNVSFSSKYRLKGTEDFCPN
jgi:hypothetical protein